MLSPDERKRRVTVCRGWKLLLTFLGLLAATVVVTFALLWAGASFDPAASIAGVYVRRLWLIALLGGLLGGIVRGLYSFLFEHYAFHFWVRPVAPRRSFVTCVAESRTSRMTSTVV